MSDDGDAGVTALALVNAHMRDCVQARIDTKSAITEVRNLLIVFIGAVFVVVVAFAGYSYVEGQTVAKQLTDAKLAAVQAVHQTAAETVEKLKEAQ